MSKVCISIKEGNEYADFDFRFGRCAFICLYDYKLDTLTYEENPFRHNADEAGVSLSKYLIAKGVCQVISGDFGKKALAHLMQNNVQMIIPKEEKTLSNFILKLKLKENL